MDLQNEIDKVVYREEIKLANHVVDKKVEACKFVRNVLGGASAISLTSAFLHSGGGDTTVTLTSGAAALLCAIGAHMASETANYIDASREYLVKKHMLENYRSQG